MLTLTRWPVKAGDRPPAVSTIVIRCPDGTEVRVRLVNIRCLTRADIGVEAPRDYRVFREELVTGVQRPGRNRRRPTRGVPFRVAAMPAELRRRRDEC